MDSTEEYQKLMRLVNRAERGALLTSEVRIMRDLIGSLFEKSSKYEDLCR